MRFKALVCNPRRQPIVSSRGLVYEANVNRHPLRLWRGFIPLAKMTSVRSSSGAIVAAALLVSMAAPMAVAEPGFVGSDICYRRFRGADEAADYVQGSARDTPALSAQDLPAVGGGSGSAAPTAAPDASGRSSTTSGSAGDKSRGSSHVDDDDRFNGRGD